MRHSSDRSISTEAGRASIEFLVFTLVLFLPLVFAILSLWQIQAAAFATEQASRDAVRVFVHHQNLAQASLVSERIAKHVVAEHGISGPLRLERSCQPSSCLTPGALVSVRVTVEVNLWQAPFWADSWPLTLPVTATSSARVSSYGGVG